MSGGRLAAPPPALLGVEIGRDRVRLALLDPEGKVVDDALEAPITGGDGQRDQMAAATSYAIATAVGRLGLLPGMPVLVGATIGFPHCGVGSGPALRSWLIELSRELGEPVVHVGDHGVSYTPVRYLDYVDEVFRSIPLRLDRVELAPVAASRTLGLIRSGTVTLGSGIAWSGRILDGEMMEAFESADGPFDEVLHLISNDTARPVEQLDGVFVDDGLCRSRGVSPGALAPAVGVAAALHDPPGRNLLDGRLLEAAMPAPQARPTDPTERRPSPLNRSGPGVGPDGGAADRPRAAAAPARGPTDRTQAGAREQPGRPTDPDPGGRLSATDLLIGALLMLTLVLVVALVVA